MFAHVSLPLALWYNRLVWRARGAVLISDTRRKRVKMKFVTGATL